MIIKFKRNLKEYRYVLAFDLAKEKTGYALVDLWTQTVPKSGMIIHDKSSESTWRDLYDQMVKTLQEIKEFCQNPFFVTKERLPSQAGPTTTIATLQSLTGAHVAWELACTAEHVDVYDYNGVHAISVKAYVRHLTGIGQPTKEDVAKTMCEMYAYELTEKTFDITDALGCIATLLNSKWDKDLKEEIGKLKVENRNSKSQKKIWENNVKIAELSENLIGG